MNIQAIRETLLDRDINTKIFVLIIVLSLIQLFDIKILLSFILFIFIFLNYDKFLYAGSTYGGTMYSINTNQIGQDMYYNTNIKSLLSQLGSFKRYNRTSYGQGVKYMRKFFKNIKMLEKEYLENYNPYFEDALIYLKTSINHFQSISVSFPERNMKDGIKYGDFEPTKKTNYLGYVCKELYNECYYLLTNISIKLNEKWAKNPTIYTKEIDMNPDRVENYNKYDEINWSLY